MILRVNSEFPGQCLVPIIHLDMVRLLLKIRTKDLMAQSPMLYRLSAPGRLQLTLYRFAWHSGLCERFIVRAPAWSELTPRIHCTQVTSSAGDGASTLALKPRAWSTEVQSIGLQFLASGLSKSTVFHMKINAFHEILIFSLVADRSCS